MAWPAVAALAITAASSAYSSRQSDKAAGADQDWLEDERDLAWSRSRKAYKSRYQDTMKDMKKAGLNPILASPNVGAGVRAERAGPAPQGQRGSAAAATGVNAGAAFINAAKNNAAKNQVNAVTQGQMIQNQIKELELKLRQKIMGMSPNSAVGLAALMARFPGLAGLAGAGAIGKQLQLTPLEEDLRRYGNEFKTRATDMWNRYKKGPK